MTYTLTLTEKEYQDYQTIKEAYAKAQWISLMETGESDWHSGRRWVTLRLLKRPELVKKLTDEIDALTVALSKKETELWNLKREIDKPKPFRQKLKELFQ